MNISDHPVNRKTILHKFLIVYRVVIGSLAAFLFIPYALFARMKIQIFREQNDQSVEALTKQQKITLLIIGSVFLIIVLRVLF